MSRAASPSALDIIQNARARELVDEDGDPLELKLEPGLSDDELAAFEAKLPCAVPPAIAELLRFCRGFSGPLELIDLTGEILDVELGEAFPHGLPIATDGFGNFWVVDLGPDSTDWAPVYFWCHDAPVVLFQSPTLAHFFTEMFKLTAPPFESLVDDVHEDRLFDVWRKNPGVLSHEQCLASGDEALAAFARELGETFLVVDMRDAEIGFGFSWGRFGPRTVIRRAGTEPIFAYEVRKGFFAKLFGPKR